MSVLPVRSVECARCGRRQSTTTSPTTFYCQRCTVRVIEEIFVYAPGQFSRLIYALLRRH
jgi:hypothetical protein